MHLRYSSRLRAVFTHAAVALACAAGAMSAAHAAFPERPLKLVVPFPPGGGTDLIARQMADGLSKDLGQTVVVEIRPGGGTIIGSDNVAKSDPDGYTLLMATFAHAVNPSIHKSLPYATNDAFVPVGMIGQSPNVLVVSPKSPFNSVQDMVAYAKKNPGKLTFGSYGNGTSAHLAGEMFKSMAGVDILHVPYRGAGPAINDLIGGQIDMIFSTAASVSGHIKQGNMKALAVTTQQRAPAFPNVPTVAESGVPGYFVDSWYGIFAAKGTPAPIRDRLNAAVQAAVKRPAFQKNVESEGLVISAGSPDALGKYVATEETRWRKIVQDAGITDAP